MELIGSGTIAHWQVYKLGDYAIKIKHPGVNEDVMSAISTYNSVKGTIFFNSTLKSLCDVFFRRLMDQLSMHNEFRMARKFKKN
jgi:hypothetical protein